MLFTKFCFYKNTCWSPKTLGPQNVTLLGKRVFTEVIKLVQLGSVAQPCPTLCNLMDCSTSGFRMSLGVYSNSWPRCLWCHPTISFSVIPFSSWSFPMSQFFASGGQSIGVSASALVLPMNIQNWLTLGWTGWISPSKGLSRVFSKTIVEKHQLFGTQLFL